MPQDAPFFTQKLQVQVLPCLICFIGGVAVDRLVGFEELGKKDDFNTAVVERKLLKAGVIVPPKRHDGDSSDDEAEQRQHVLQKSCVTRTGSDEDSDFD
jgi:hypothetical protein